MSIHQPGYPNNQSQSKELAVTEVTRLPSNTVLASTQRELNMIRQQRVALAAQEREITQAFQSNGGSKKVLRVLRQIEAMEEPEEREAFLVELDAYCSFLRYW